MRHFHSTTASWDPIPGSGMPSCLLMKLSTTSDRHMQEEWWNVPLAFLYNVGEYLQGRSASIERTQKKLSRLHVFCTTFYRTTGTLMKSWRNYVPEVFSMPLIVYSHCNDCLVTGHQGMQWKYVTNSRITSWALELNHGKKTMSVGDKAYHLCNWLVHGHKVYNSIVQSWQVSNYIVHDGKVSLPSNIVDRMAVQLAVLAALPLVVGCHLAAIAS